MNDADRKGLLKILEAPADNLEKQLSIFKERVEMQDQVLATITKERTAATKDLAERISKLNKELAEVNRPFDKRETAASTSRGRACETVRNLDAAVKFNRFVTSIQTVTTVQDFAKVMLMYDTNWNGKSTPSKDEGQHYDVDFFTDRFKDLGFREITNDKGCLVIGWRKYDDEKSDKYYVALKNGKIVAALFVQPAQHIGDSQWGHPYGVKRQKVQYYKGAEWSERSVQGLKVWLEHEFVGMKKEELLDFLER